MKEINLNISKLTASVLQRMIFEEIENQKEWKKDDLKNRGEVWQTRDNIISELEELAKEIDKQGVNIYFRY